MEIRPFVCKIFEIILKILMVLIIILGLLIVYGIYALIKGPTIYKKISKYNKCIDSEYYQESIKHFPKSIPDYVSDAKLYCFPSRFENDGALILLKIKADKKYIKKELNNHKFLNPKTPVGTQQKIYNMPSEMVGIERDKLTYYVLDDKSNYNENGQYFPYFTGIGVDKNYEYILYYYIRPD